MPKLTPKQFWLRAAEWGSALTSGDVGACMYGFDKDGVVQSERHRQDCLDYIAAECRKAADVNVKSGESVKDNHGVLDSLVAYLRTAPVAGAVHALDGFAQAYLEAALSTSTDTYGEGEDVFLGSEYSVDHVAPDALRQAVADCAKFQEFYGDLLARENYSGPGADHLRRAGVDFWLTRNGHGAGFWDGDWEEPAASVLTAGARNFGECELYVGDDGRIYATGGVSGPAKAEGASPTP